MEGKTKLSGYLKGKHIVIEDFDSAQEIYQSGFGIKEKKELVLNAYEGLYLCSIEKLEVISRKEALAFDRLMGIFYKKDRNILSRFLVYRDLRARGFIIKEGFGFGVDFRVYDKGDYGTKAAKYVVFVLNEGSDIALWKIFEDVTSIKKMGKESIIAVVDRRGEIIYYQISEEFFGAKN
ncbi:MAG: tRNA-intron lyase [Nitrososphaeria archaeon]